MFSALLLPLTSDALAGGIGLMATGGAHNEALYYYESVDADGNVITDPDQFVQFKDPQIIPNFGGGLEFLLGDRDDRIFGVTRFFYQQDLAQGDPTQGAQNPDAVVVAYRDQARHVGVGTIGLSWGSSATRTGSSSAWPPTSARRSSPTTTPTTSWSRPAP